MKFVQKSDTELEETILTIDQRDFEDDADISQRDTYCERIAVRAVVLNEKREVALLHAAQRDYYKLPGGGVDVGEHIQSALARELMEEIGATVSITAELGKTVEYKDVERLTQTSYCFIATVVGDSTDPSFTDDEKAEGFSVVWAKDIDEAVHLLSSRNSNSDMHVQFMTTRDNAILRAARSWLES